MLMSERLPNPVIASALVESRALLGRPLSFGFSNSRVDICAHRISDEFLADGPPSTELGALEAPFIAASPFRA
jgi:hypothetical protein